jgi:hypothetical protein
MKDGRTVGFTRAAVSESRFRGSDSLALHETPRGRGVSRVGRKPLLGGCTAIVIGQGGAVERP